MLEASGDPPVEDVEALEDLEDEDGGPAEDEDDHEHGKHGNQLGNELIRASNRGKLFITRFRCLSLFKIRIHISLKQSVRADLS